MEDIDLMRIEDFLLNLSKPIVQKKDKPSSTVKLPILKISEWMKATVDSYRDIF